MKRLVHRYRISKFKIFANGLLFAIITIIALALCIADISDHTADAGILFPFSIAILSMLMGIFSMYHNSEIPKEKI